MPVRQALALGGETLGMRLHPDWADRRALAMSLWHDWLDRVLPFET
ncbi:hypothetical protein [Roseibium sp.]